MCEGGTRVVQLWYEGGTRVVRGSTAGGTSEVLTLPSTSSLFFRPLRIFPVILPLPVSVSGDRARPKWIGGLEEGARGRERRRTERERQMFGAEDEEVKVGAPPPPPEFSAIDSFMPGSNLRERAALGGRGGDGKVRRKRHSSAHTHTHARTRRVTRHVINTSHTHHVHHAHHTSEGDVVGAMDGLLSLAGSDGCRRAVWRACRCERGWRVCVVGWWVGVL